MLNLIWRVIIFLFIAGLFMPSESSPNHSWNIVIYVIIAILIIAAVLYYLVSKIIDYLMYKDETPEEREERLNTEKMIEEWKKGHF